MHFILATMDICVRYASSSERLGELTMLVSAYQSLLDNSSITLPRDDCYVIGKSTQSFKYLMNSACIKRRPRLANMSTGKIPEGIMTITAKRQSLEKKQTDDRLLRKRGPTQRMTRLSWTGTGKKIPITLSTGN
jgi:hypothetical protein